MAETAVRERPILFSLPMVKAILDGRKTMTRRIVVPQPSATGDNGGPLREIVPSLLLNRGDLFDVRYDGDNPRAIRCPHGGAGDHLWVKETFAPRSDVDPVLDPDKARRYCLYAADGSEHPRHGAHWHDFGDRWRPSIFMPRWASRLTLEIAEVRVERLREITDDDAVAEGIVNGQYDPGLAKGGKPGWCYGEGRYAGTPRRAFELLWDSINGQRPGCSWASDPFVWCLSFRVLPREGGSARV